MTAVPGRVVSTILKKNNSCMEFPLAWYQPVDFYTDAVTLDGKAEEEATY